MRDHWLNAVAITAIATVAAAVAPVLSLIPTRQTSDGPSAERRAHERRSMLSRVRSDWIVDVLLFYYAEAPQLDLRRQSRPDLIADRADRPGRAAGQIPATRNPLQILDDAYGTLLITGAPGPGKSQVLLELTQELIERAETDRVAPVPVVFNLAS
jgi:Cdc6-like AAA superfamily ATPase